MKEDEIKVFLSADYGVDSKSGNKTIGKEIVKTINSFHIKKDRECFYAQRVKDSAIKNLSQNKRVGNAIKIGIASNYVHQMMLYQIRTFLFFKNGIIISGFILATSLSIIFKYRIARKTFFKFNIENGFQTHSVRKSV